MTSTFCAVVEFLEKWQTLIGAAIGGIIGLLAALIVAHDARHREERAAAMLLSIDLTSVQAAKAALDERIEHKQIKPDEVPSWITTKLMNSRPKLSPLFDTSMARLMPVDDYLSAHLALFGLLYGETLEMVGKLVQANDALKKTGQTVLTDDEVNAYTRLIHSGFLKACEHATCANHLLNRYVLHRIAFLYRWGKTLRIIKHEKSCLELLKRG